jgi:hypothetical protein
MKHRLKAASIALAISMVPGILFAGTSGGSMVVTGFDPGKELLSGINESWQIERVRHTAGTEHAYVSAPNALPPGPCKSIAIAWNLFVYQNRPHGIPAPSSSCAPISPHRTARSSW